MCNKITPISPERQQKWNNFHWKSLILKQWIFRWKLLCREYRLFWKISQSLSEIGLFSDPLISYFYRRHQEPSAFAARKRPFQTSRGQAKPSLDVILSFLVNSCFEGINKKCFLVTWRNRRTLKVWQTFFLFYKIHYKMLLFQQIFITLVHCSLSRIYRRFSLDKTMANMRKLH